MTPEGAVLRDCLDACRLLGLFVFRVNQQGVPIHGQPGRFRPGPSRGVSDIIGLTRRGRFVAVECKSQRGRLTAEQRAFLAAVEAHGGLAIVARSAADVVQALKEGP